MKKIFSILFFAVALSACQSNEKKNEVNDPLKNSLPTTINQGTQSGVRPTHNPPHGQPFHDCNLPDGAPFPTEGTSQSATQTLPKPQVEIQQPAATSAPVKTNPAHGMPGHKCELPVGAPLT